MPNPDGLTYEELCTNYDDIINKSIALASSKDLTIFDIAKNRYNEKVISNWYAFFFDPDAEHSLDDLFLKSLIEIINKHNNEFDMEGCYVKREFPTDEGGFVDLVLYEQSEEGERFASAIIIENKIYAPVKNNLDDYYESVKVVEPDQKVGVVLSLHKIKDKDLPEEFINITHEELLEAIQRKLGEYVLSAKLKYILYLQDFISNLEQMTKMQDYMKFYFERGEKIQALLTIKSQSLDYIINNLRRIIDNNETWKWGGTHPYYVAFRKSEIEIWYNLEHSEVFETKKFRLTMWLRGEKTVQAWKTKGGQNEIYSKYKHESKFTVKEDIGKNPKWGLLAEKDYDVKNIEELEDFGEKVLQILTNDWSKLMEDITDLLIPPSVTETDSQ